MMHVIVLLVAMLSKPMSCDRVPAYLDTLSMELFKEKGYVVIDPQSWHLMDARRWSFEIYTTKPFTKFYGSGECSGRPVT